MAAALLEKRVSGRKILGVLTQFTSLRAFRGRKLLIVKGEMAEWSMAHAWKAIAATLTE
jgi:hypothetical protein